MGQPGSSEGCLCPETEMETDLGDCLGLEAVIQGLRGHLGTAESVLGVKAYLSGLALIAFWLSREQLSLSKRYKI